MKKRGGISKIKRKINECVSKDAIKDMTSANSIILMEINIFLDISSLILL